jgi:hypothetical protein
MRPQGQLTLSMSANQAVQEELLRYLASLKADVSSPNNRIFSQTFG